MVKIKNKPDTMNINKGFQIVLLLLFFAGFIYDVFFIAPAFNLVSDVRLFSFVLLWLFLSKISNFSSKSTFKVTIGFLIILFFLFLFFKTSTILDRVSSWIYIFLCIGVVQQFLESRMYRLKPKMLQ